ncbi:MAG: hypothetical protein KGL46_03840 [Hyphomicrobiales bacterium]|nr:hypothetical protein [Hyphomicrobiales bacterium]
MRDHSKPLSQHVEEMLAIFIEHKGPMTLSPSTVEAMAFWLENCAASVRDLERRAGAADAIRATADSVQQEADRIALINAIFRGQRDGKVAFLRPRGRSEEDIAAAIIEGAVSFGGEPA